MADCWREVDLLSGEVVGHEQLANAYPLGTPVPAIAGHIALTNRRLLFSPRKVERQMRRAEVIKIPYSQIESVSTVRRVVLLRKALNVETHGRKYYFLVKRLSRFVKELAKARPQG
jgi:hypothetical protein